METTKGLKYILVASLFIMTCPALSQNLVPNPSFECGVDICGPTQEALKFSTYACNWSCPTEGTSDILSTLLPDKTCFSSVPYNGTNILGHVGSQLPRTGNRFAGIITYSGGPVDFQFNSREYLQVKLKAPLTPGEYYCAEMYISSADALNFASNNMGMYFADNETALRDKRDTLPYTPQIIEKNVVNDTVHWVRVSGTFKATSAAKYLIIGNFNTDRETTKIKQIPSGDDYYGFAYYFIDDVSVEHLPPQNLTIDGRTEICQGETTTLKTIGFSHATWTTLTDTLTVLSYGDSLKVQPQVTTQYRVTVRNCNLIVKDTITVTVHTFLRVHLGNDTTICNGTSIELNAGALLGSVYEWQDKSSSQYLKVNQAGKYSVRVSNPFNNCVGYDEINVAIKMIPKINLGNDTTVCSDFFPLKAGKGGATQYQWSTGSVDSIFTPTKPGKYWVTVENRCGQSSDSIRVYSAANIFIPNVLTLNSDNLNEEFRLAVGDGQTQILNTELIIPGKLNVFNRWGHQIFSDPAYTNGWPPGSIELEPGVYYYTFDYLNCPTFKGSINVLK